MATKLVALLRRHAEKHPQFGEELRGCAEEIEWAAQAKPEDPTERVVAALKLGCGTVPEVMRWTGLKDWKVRRILKGLVRDNLVTVFGPGEVVARSSVGNRVEIYVLKEVAV